MQEILGQSMTTTGGSASNVTVYPTGDQWPWSNTIAYYYYPTVPTEPTFCMGKAHVFECDHEPKCKCGAIERHMGQSKGGKKMGGKRGC